MSLAIALTSYDSNMWNTSVIYRVVLLCIFLSSLRGWYNGASLKYQSWKLYRVIGKR